MLRAFIFKNNLIIHKKSKNSETFYEIKHDQILHSYKTIK